MSVPIKLKCTVFSPRIESLAGKSVLKYRSIYLIGNCLQQNKVVADSDILTILTLECQVFSYDHYFSSTKTTVLERPLTCIWNCIGRTYIDLHV